MSGPRNPCRPLAGGTTAATPTLALWTVYDHPRDAPAVYRARLWMVLGVVVCPTDDVMDELTLEALRRRLARMGLIRIARFKDDDPVILETWL